MQVAVVDSEKENSCTPGSCQRLHEYATQSMTTALQKHAMTLCCFTPKHTFYRTSSRECLFRVTCAYYSSGKDNFIIPSEKPATIDSFNSWR